MYSYESENCPQTDYDKFKDHVLNDKVIYLSEPYHNDSDTFYINVIEVEIKAENSEIEKDGKDYYRIELCEYGTETVEFKTKEQINEFIKNNVITMNLYDYISQFVSEQRVMSFDDENLELEASLTQLNWYHIFSMDLILINILAAGAIIFAYIILGTVLCYRKKKTLIK